MHVRLAVLLIGLSVGSQFGLSPATASDFEKYLQGRHVFKSQCAPCHGTTGRGNGPWAEGMPIQPRNFRMGIFKYRTTPMGFQPTEDDLRRTIQGGVSGTAMPTFAKSLSKRDLDAILVYLQNLSSRWQDSARSTNSAVLPKTPDWFFKGDELKVHARTGQALFNLICVNCHGATGQGNGPQSASLTNVWGHAAVPADLRLPHHRSGPRREDLFRTIAMGLDGTPMIGFRGALTDEQIWELIAVIESFPKPPKK
jgi:mono/diheme cytochrome c family protein